MDSGAWMLRNGTACYPIPRNDLMIGVNYLIGIYMRLMNYDVVSLSDLFQSLPRFIWLSACSFISRF